MQSPVLDSVGAAASGRSQQQQQQQQHNAVNSDRRYRSRCCYRRD